MLVLSRKPKEEIRIGESIRVVVVRIKGDKVQIGIEAPMDTEIRRAELVEQDGATD